MSKSNKLLVFDKVSKKLGGKQIIQEATLSVAKGEVVGIVEANGSGKTTLLRLATGMFYPDQGEVRVAGMIKGRLIGSVIGYTGWKRDGLYLSVKVV